MQENTLWFRVNVWGKQADAVNQFLSKGRQVYVEGRLSQQEYTDKDGNRRTSLEVRATDVQFLGARGDEGGVASAPSSRPATTQSSGGEESEDIPF
jgi:single-strand DNA-binding protein